MHERHQDQQAEPERRQRQAAEADHPQHIVERCVLPHRADHAERNPEQHREDQRQRGQLQAVTGMRGRISSIAGFSDT
jgi:hypothetical protein